jgi:hypothetical protein
VILPKEASQVKKKYPLVDNQLATLTVVYEKATSPISLLKLALEFTTRAVALVLKCSLLKKFMFLLVDGIVWVAICVAPLVEYVVFQYNLITYELAVPDLSKDVLIKITSPTLKVPPATYT